MTRIITVILLLLISSSAFAQKQTYHLKPFVCPTNQFVFGFNPKTIGNPGWFCGTYTPAPGGLGGQKLCVTSVTVVNGKITAATAGTSCSPVPGSYIVNDAGTSYILDDSGTSFVISP